MSKRKIQSMVLLLGLAISTITYAQNSARHEFSIQQSVEYAYKNNVQVKNALLNIQVQQQTNRDITSAALPTVSGNLSGNDYLQLPVSLLPGEFFGSAPGTFIPVRFGVKYNASATIQLQQLLFDGQVFIGLQARKTSIDFQTKNKEVTEEMIKTNIHKIYYQLVLKLDDALQRQSVLAAEKGLETLKTQLSFAKTLYQKQKNLWDQNIGTEVQLITAKNNVETLESQLKSAEEQVKISREQLQFTSVYSDVDGVAEDVNIRIGELFAGAGQIKIVNTSNLKVTTEVPENYLDRVGKGSKLKITLPDINKSVEASVSVSGRIINPISRSFFIEAKLPNDKDFRPNQIAMVQIQDYTLSNAIVVPINTLQNDEKGKYVMVASKEGGKLVARKKMVTAGEFYGDKLEIKTGLQTGDLVIVEGYQSLYDGQIITTNSK